MTFAEQVRARARQIIAGDDTVPVAAIATLTDTECYRCGADLDMGHGSVLYSPTRDGTAPYTLLCVACESTRRTERNALR